MKRTTQHSHTNTHTHTHNDHTRTRTRAPQIKGASRLAGVSTASQGKFDRRLPGEKDGERSLQLGRRRKFLAVADTAAERRQVAGVADRLLRERADDIIGALLSLGVLRSSQTVAGFLLLLLRLPLRSAPARSDNACVR